MLQDAEAVRQHAITKLQIHDMRKFSIIKFQSGYTLIEILVVLSIIGLLFGFGYANFRDFSRRQALASLSKQIQGDLRLAQQMSFSGQKPAGCGANTLNGIRFGVTTAPPYVYIIRAVCGSEPYPVIKEFDFSGDITPTPVTASPNPLIFKVLGQGTNIGAADWVLTLTQAGTGNVATVTVTTGGEIK